MGRFSDRTAKRGPVDRSARSLPRVWPERDGSAVPLERPARRVAPLPALPPLRRGPYRRPLPGRRPVPSPRVPAIPRIHPSFPNPIRRIMPVVDFLDQGDRWLRYRTNEIPTPEGWELFKDCGYTGWGNNGVKALKDYTNPCSDVVNWCWSGQYVTAFDLPYTVRDGAHCFVIGEANITEAGVETGRAVKHYTRTVPGPTLPFDWEYRFIPYSPLQPDDDFSPSPLRDPNKDRRSPSPAPLVHPSVSADPYAPPARREIVADPLPRFALAELGPHQRSRNGRKERKVLSRSKTLMLALFRGLDLISEASEVVEAFYDALPESVRKRWERDRGRPEQIVDAFGQYGISGADWRLSALYFNWHRVDIEVALKNVLLNQLEDDIYGAIHRGLPVNSGTAFDPAFMGIADLLKDLGISS